MYILSKWKYYSWTCTGNSQQTFNNCSHELCEQLDINIFWLSVLPYTNISISFHNKWYLNGSSYYPGPFSAVVFKTFY